MTKQFFAKMAAAAMLALASLLGYAQNRAISGTVVDASGAPVCYSEQSGPDFPNRKL